MGRSGSLCLAIKGGKCFWECCAKLLSAHGRQRFMGSCSQLPPHHRLETHYLHSVPHQKLSIPPLEEGVGSFLSFGPTSHMSFFSLPPFLSQTLSHLIPFWSIFHFCLARALQTPQHPAAARLFSAAWPGAECTKRQGIWWPGWNGARTCASPELGKTATNPPLRSHPAARRSIAAAPSTSFDFHALPGAARCCRQRGWPRRLGTHRCPHHRPSAPLHMVGLTQFRPREGSSALPHLPPYKPHSPTVFQARYEHQVSQKMQGMSGTVSVPS